MREHVVGASVAKYAARGLADGGACGGDDVGVLDLFHGFLRKPGMGSGEWGIGRYSQLLRNSGFVEFVKYSDGLAARRGFIHSPFPTPDSRPRANLLNF